VPVSTLKLEPCTWKPLAKSEPTSFYGWKKNMVEELEFQDSEMCPTELELERS
jgi:hypothetical protein